MFCGCSMTFERHFLLLLYISQIQPEEKHHWALEKYEDDENVIYFKKKWMKQFHPFPSCDAEVK